MKPPRRSPNRRLLVDVAAAVRPMLDELTFVGGHVAELLVTDPMGVRVRQTDDVDAVVEVTTRSQFFRLEERLRGLGLRHDMRPGAPICRWLTRTGVKFDVMPADGSVLQFSNQWYGEVIRSAHHVGLGADLTIRVASAPAFLATKWEAYSDRGKGDLLGSHDVEDIITVVAGRDSLVAEIRAAPAALQAWLSARTQAFLADPNADYALQAALPDAAFDPEILERVRLRLQAIAEQ